MHPALSPPAWLPLLAAGAAAWPGAVGAQVFVGDYRLAMGGMRAASGAAAPAASRLLWVSGAPLTARPITPGGSPGTGLSFVAGGSWLEQLGRRRDLVRPPMLPAIGDNAHSAGYGWTYRQAMPLRLTRGVENPYGLALRYEWPRYFVRVSYDTALGKGWPDARLCTASEAIGAQPDVRAERKRCNPTRPAGAEWR